jgi:tetratricopeptide (TPR) repeat protein
MYELGLAYQNKGSLDQALEWFERASVASKNEPASVMLRGHIYALLGRAADARRQREKLVEMSNRQYVPALYTAFIYAGERNADEAFAWFDRACDERSSYMIYLDVEPSLDHLRGDPRFEALVQRVGVRGNASGALGSAKPRGNQNRTPNPKPTNA